MSATPTKILTDLQPDDALDQNSTSFNRTDRQYIDTQIRGCQQHLATALLNGIHATYVRVDAGSSLLSAGDIVCLAGSGLGYPTVTLALPTPLAAAGSAYGIVLLAASPGAYALIAISGLVSPSITGLAATSGQARVSTAGRVERVASLSTGDYPLGSVDAAGYLTLLSGVAVSSSGGTGFQWTPRNGNGGTNNAVDKDALTVGAGDTVVLPVDTAAAHPATILVINDDAGASVNVNASGIEVINSTDANSVTLAAKEIALFVGSGAGKYAMFQGV